MISVLAGAGRIISGRPASELTFCGVTVEGGCCGSVEGVDADAEVCTEMYLKTIRGLAERRAGQLGLWCPL